MNRICVASSGLGHVARGIEAWANDLGSALAQRGEDVLLCKGGGSRDSHHERVVSCWPRDAARTRLLVRSIPNSIGWRIGFGSGYAVEQITFSRSLIKILRGEEIDVLHVQDPFVASQVQIAFRQGHIKTKTILAHGTEESLDFQSQFTYLQHLAPWHRQEAQNAGIDQKSWTTIPNFIDTDLFRPGINSELRDELSIPHDGLVILTSAAIKRKHKRIDFLIEEFRTLRAAAPALPVWLVIAGGRESDTDELIAMGNGMLGDRVRFLVQFPRVRMADLYRMADVFTIASLKEMMPIALLEAAASGLSCVVHQHPVMQWMMGPGGASLDLSLRGSLARAWENTLSDLKEAERIGMAARQHCCEHFATDVVVDQILRYYEQVTSETRAAA